jgi:predicted RNA binding protein YcfA (HicA-like mRNA interferase family)
VPRNSKAIPVAVGEMAVIAESRRDFRVCSMSWRAGWRQRNPPRSCRATNIRRIALRFKIRPTRAVIVSSEDEAGRHPHSFRTHAICLPRPSRYSVRMRVREVVRMLGDDGWVLVATRGSHRQYKHPSKPGRVTVPGKPNDDLAPGTLNSIFKQEGLKK